MSERSRAVWFIVFAIVVFSAATAYLLRSRLGALPYVGSRFGSAPPRASAEDHAKMSAPANGAEAAPRGEITIDPRRQQLIGVQIVSATRTAFAPTIRTVGAVRSDETRLTDVNVKIEGWIRDLYVDYTGQPVIKGQTLFTLYSPDLLATENEYLLALKTRDRVQQSVIADARERADQLVTSARQRLALWDLPDEEIRALESSGQPHAAVPFQSPVSGVVTEKTAIKGMHITPGQSLYKVADLSVVWVEAEVYESEMPLLRVGRRATITLNAYPGERFVGRVIYVYPYVDEKTRTNKVRYELANSGGRLKPGMFANVEMAAPEMRALTVPPSAVLDSGTEQLVFVAKGEGHFEPRRVKVGRRVPDRLEILEGLKDGEAVATGATFFLDSESQLRASLQGFEAQPALPAPGGTERLIDITFRSTPDPPRMGENQFEAAVKDAAGLPIADSQVEVQFFMPAMPTMNMPAMRSEVKLSSAGGGVYRGTGQVVMAGRWEVTVSVTRDGRRIASKQLPVVVR